MNKLAPIAVYTYNRINHLTQTIDALKSNFLAPESEIFIVSDAAYREEDKESVDKIREYIESIQGFKCVHKIFRNKNLGSFNSITYAEQSILADYGRIISLEDDIVTSKNFLNFLNQGLDYYSDNEKILTIAGYCHPIKIENNSTFDVWFSPWHCPWGYATWKHKYISIDKNKNLLNEIRKNKKLFKKLQRDGSFFIDTLERDAAGNIKALDARICSYMLMNDMYTVMPKISKVSNIGCDGSGLHCEKTDIFDVKIDTTDNISYFFKDIDNVFYSVETRQYLKFMNGNYFNVIISNLIRLARSFRAYKYAKKVKLYFHK